MANSSPGSAHTLSATGWSNNSVFLKFLNEHFKKHLVAREEGEKVLLLFDGHRSHICPEVRRWARENDIILFLLPPHTSHKLQPLDVSCFGPLKNKYKQVLIWLQLIKYFNPRYVMIIHFVSMSALGWQWDELICIHPQWFSVFNFFVIAFPN